MSLWWQATSGCVAACPLCQLYNGSCALLSVVQTNHASISSKMHVVKPKRICTYICSPGDQPLFGSLLHNCVLNQLLHVQDSGEVAVLYNDIDTNTLLAQQECNGKVFTDSDDRGTSQIKTTTCKDQQQVHSLHQKTAVQVRFWHRGSARPRHKQPAREA